MAGLIATSDFNQLGQYTSSPGNSAYCYAELAVSSLAVAETVTSTHCAYLRRDGQAEYTCVTLVKHQDGGLYRRASHPGTVPSCNMQLYVHLCRASFACSCINRQVPTLIPKSREDATRLRHLIYLHMLQPPPR